MPFRKFSEQFQLSLEQETLVPINAVSGCCNPPLLMFFWTQRPKPLVKGRSEQPTNNTCPAPAISKGAEVWIVQTGHWAITMQGPERTVFVNLKVKPASLRLVKDSAYNSNQHHGQSFHLQKRRERKYRVNFGPPSVT